MRHTEDMYDIGKDDDPNSFREAVSCENSAKWVEAMEEELKSMSSNDVWDAHLWFEYLLGIAC